MNNIMQLPAAPCPVSTGQIQFDQQDPGFYITADHAANLALHLISVLHMATVNHDPANIPEFVACNNTRNLILDLIGVIHDPVTGSSLAMALDHTYNPCQV